MTDAHGNSLDQLAAQELDEFDAEVLASTRRMFDTLDAMPAGLVDRIQFGLTLDALHAEVAELQRSASLAGVRSEDAMAGTSVTFTTPTLTAMVTATPTSGDHVRIDGWITPGAGVLVELRLVADIRSTTADEDGRFVFDDVPKGLAQFVLRSGHDTESATVVTPSIEL